MHIEIREQKDCSGCCACANVCPQQCIEMSPDKLGFKYPKVDTSRCIDCGLCVKVCPFISVYDSFKPLGCYAAVNRNEATRLRSSSGGVFNALAKLVIENGGVVFGAVYDEQFNVIHSSALCENDVIPMMGSKYVQSDLTGTYLKAKEHLKNGQIVLFTGTPCQIAGLNHFLRRDYPNLLTVELICHGVPSPYVWRKYLAERLSEQTHNSGDAASFYIKKINFRDKRSGWRNFGIAIEFGQHDGATTSPTSTPAVYYKKYTDDPFMVAFLKNLSLRPSCYYCKAKSGASRADITLGDFWGIEHYSGLQSDDEGTSCVIARTQKGDEFIAMLSECDITKCEYEQIFAGNISLEHSVYLSETAIRFKKAIFRYAIAKSIKEAQHQTLFDRIFNACKRRLNIKSRN